MIYCNSSNYTDRIDDIGIVAFEGMVDGIDVVDIDSLG
jgi:hypothetical protein